MKITHKPSQPFGLALALASAIAVSGCATAFSTNEYTVNIRTPEEPGKTFEVIDSKDNFIYKGKTPDIVRLKAQSKNFVRERYTIQTEGGEPVSLKASITPIYWANVLNLLGFAVDFATGTMWSLPGEVDLDTHTGDNMLINVNL